MIYKIYIDYGKGYEKVAEERSIQQCKNYINSLQNDTDRLMIIRNTKENGDEPFIITTGEKIKKREEIEIGFISGSKQERMTLDYSFTKGKTIPVYDGGSELKDKGIDDER